MATDHDRTGHPADDLTARRLVEQYGSPLYIYDLARVRASLEDLRAALPQPCRVYYSLKANSHPELVAELRRGGARAEVTSRGELAAALEAGHPAAELMYSGPGKVPAELDEAIAAGMRTFSAESFGDLERIGAAADARGVTADCVLRINAAGAPGQAGLRMTGGPSQFGFDLDDLAEHGARLLVKGVRIIGMHFFPLTNSRDEDGLIAELAQSVRTAAQLREELGIPLHLLDLGGGFAAPYANPGERPVYGRLRTALTAVLDEHLPGWRDGEPVIAFESGRYLIGDSGRLVVTVTDVKNSRGSTYAVLDSGINHLGGLSGLGRLLPLSAQPLADTGRAADEPADREAATVTLAGPLCTPADILARAAQLPGLRAGDLLAFPNVGAYGLSASLLGFLGHPAPAEVVVDGGETVSATRLALRRDSVAPHTGSRTEDLTTMTETTTQAAPATADEPAAPWDATFEALLLEALPRLAAKGELQADSSLKAAGLDSLAMVEVLVRVEETYGIAVPDSELMADTFATPASLWRVVAALREQSVGSA
ncbi:phosphopantetheine-binding protein [Streptomyces neyagawaensis]|uniref:phosphopantetheine-binding protein n=1 Tax=Streptomyces neyagawaensis TaxID=42238 RepID=UPI0006E16716|nr:phosphopantetheine-binding protein [Streptomyces neyagawaensis]MCL6732890.1 phosphopantetheine-binding protein [Streptomyces neyagawaensis]MDE1681342.1 phosphopantetheine-binding protein [Streptomyces neyagawaensis]